MRPDNDLFTLHRCLSDHHQDRYRLIQERRMRENSSSLWHASSSGSCIRKHLFKVIIEHKIELDPTRTPAHTLNTIEQARGNYNIQQADSEFINLMLSGHDTHHDIEAIWHDHGLISHGDMVSQPSEQHPLKTLLKIEEPDALVPIITVIGTIDAISNVRPRRIIDIQRIGDNQAYRMMKMAHENNDGLPMVEPKRMKAMQVTVYHESLIQAGREDIEACPIILYAHGKGRRFWAPVDPENWKYAVYDYWLRVADAWYYLKEEGRLPETTPEEKWECYWRTGRCLFYDICRRERENNREQFVDEELMETMEDIDVK